MNNTHANPVRVYIAVYLALMVLLATTVGVSFLHLGPLALAAALLIAAAKTMLVLVYFMHLRGSNRLVRLFAGAGFFWLILMLVLVLSDYATRSWAP